MTTVTSRPPVSEEGRFRIGDVFPSDQRDRVRLAQLIVTGRVLLSVVKAYRLLDKNYEPEAEARAHLMLLSFGAALEAAKAFAYADEEGCLTEFEGWLEAWPSGPELEDVRQCLKRLRVNCDRNNPDSLRCRLLQAARNQASFHWDPERIGPALNALEDETVAAILLSDQRNSAHSSVPLAERVSLAMLDGLAVAGGSRPGLETELSQLQGDLFRVAMVVLNWLWHDAETQRGGGCA